MFVGRVEKIIRQFLVRSSMIVGRVEKITPRRLVTR